MKFNQQKFQQLVIGIVTIAAVVYLVQLGEVNGDAALTVIVGVAAGLGGYQFGKQRGQNTSR